MIAGTGQTPTLRGLAPSAQLRAAQRAAAASCGLGRCGRQELRSIIAQRASRSVSDKSLVAECKLCTLFLGKYRPIPAHNYSSACLAIWLELRPRAEPICNR